MQNNHLYTINDSKSLTLWRFPKQADDSPLQAWDTADKLLAEYVLSKIAEKDRLNSALIVNDNFGAVTCHLNQISPSVFTDSKVSELATTKNIELNNLAPVKIETDTEALKNYPLVLVKLPKNLDFLQFILQQAHQSQFQDVEIIAVAKATDINKSVVKLFNRYFENVEVSLAKRKSRTITASGKQKSPYTSFQAWQKWQHNELDIYNASNVFSRSSLDLGASFLLDYIPNTANKDVIDLACGNGILGLSILKTQTPNSVIFSDESHMAIDSVTKNLNSNGFENSNIKISTIWQDCLTETEDESADIIICNPPFHQQKTITDHIALQMFNDAQRVLRKGGELRLVGNQHLGYFQKLLTIFDDVKVLATNDKFVIISATKN